MNLWVGSYCDWTKQLALSLLAKNHWHPAMATNGDKTMITIKCQL